MCILNLFFISSFLEEFFLLMLYLYLQAYLRIWHPIQSYSSGRRPSDLWTYWSSSDLPQQLHTLHHAPPVRPHLSSFGSSCAGRYLVEHLDLRFLPCLNFHRIGPSLHRNPQQHLVCHLCYQTGRWLQRHS